MKKKVVFGLLVTGWIVFGAVGADVSLAGDVPTVPLPSTVPLLGLGLALLGWARRKS